MKQKQIKAQKQEIVEESALNVGYYESVIPEIIKNIDPDTFYHLMGMESGEWLLQAAKSKQRAEFQNILVSEAVKNMPYSDFKTIAHYFFNYSHVQDEIIAEPLEVSLEKFTQLQNEADEVFNTTFPDQLENNREANQAEEFFDFELVQSKILEDLRKAQLNFKEELINKSPEHVYNQASKIIYVSDALLELESFIEEFTSEDYQERSYSYEKQLSALFDRYQLDSPQNGSEIFLAAVERSWSKTDGNYEIGSDDKSTFMENYVADYFELSPYLNPQEAKTVEPTSSPQQSKSHSL